MRIEIHEYVSQRPRGDRDPHRHPCSSFRVVLINGGKTATLFRNDQFDGFWTSIQGNREQYLSEAQKEAKHFAETMDCEADLEPTTAPGRIEELRERIARDQTELTKLEKEHARLT